MTDMFHREMRSILLLVTLFVASSALRCDLSEIERRLVLNNPKLSSIIGKFTPRSILTTMQFCTSLVGDIKVNSIGTNDNGFGEFVRTQDLEHLKHLKYIFGNVTLDLSDYKEVKDLFFLNGVTIKNVSASKPSTFTLQNSQVTHLFPPKYTLDVLYVKLINNTELCYLDSLGDKYKLTNSGNKPSENCTQDGAVCDDLCTSCSGPGRMTYLCTCKSFSYKDNCISRCPNGTFLNGPSLACADCSNHGDLLMHNYTFKTNWETCYFCSIMCAKGCSGRSERECLQCKYYKHFYDKSNENKVECVFDCPKDAKEIQDANSGIWITCSTDTIKPSFACFSLMVISVFVSKIKIW